MAEIRVVALDHIVLRVRDLERSLSFYRDMLGLPIEFLDDYRAGARPFVSARVGGSLVDLVPDPSFDPRAGATAGGFLHFCVRVSGPVAEAVAALRRRGVEVLEEQPAMRMGASGLGASVYVRDPDGYVVELKE